MEVTLDIPVVSWGWRRDEGEEEERIRTEEQVVRQKEEPTPSCPGPGEWQERRGGKSHDAYTGMTHIIVGYGL